MKINILHFGEVECSEEEILRFPKGLFGFPEETQFYLMMSPEQAPFMVLQSLLTPHLAFVVIDPWMIEPDYGFDLPKETKEELYVENEEDIMVLGIVVIPDNIKKMTINLRAPLIINIARRVGEQIILSEDRFDIRHPMLKD